MPYHIGKSADCPESKPHAVIKDSDGKVMGCHATRGDAEKQIAAIHASEGDHAVDTVEFITAGPAVTGGYEANIADMVGTPWEGILAVEGVETGDGREFAENVLTWADPPLPLRRNIEDSHGGMPTTKTVLVGRIDELWRNPDNPLEIRGRGVFDDQGDHGAEAVRLVRGKFLKGVSVDPDDISDADIELVFPEGDAVEDEDAGLFDLFAMPEKTIFHAGRLRAATLVDIPAFVEAQIWLADSPPSTEVSATAADDVSHFGPLSDRVWNGPLHEGQLSAQMTVQTARTAFAFVSTGTGSAVSKTAARFLHHEISNGSVGSANITACAASIRAINNGRASTLSDADRRRAYDHLAQHLRSAGLVPPPYESGEVIISSGFEHLIRPPRAWFNDPQLHTYTPITVTDDGHVYGHGAEWGACHTSFGDVCTRPPREPNGDHTYYRLGEIACSDGSRVAVGAITMGISHAPTRNITPSRAAEHYDNTDAVIAYVASGEDAHGIWVSGAVRPDTTETRVQLLRSAKLSGDWRRIGGAMRLVAFLAVNVPGFPVPRTQAFVSQGRQLSLVAAGIPMREPQRAHPGVDLAIQRIARSIGRDPASRIAEIKTRVRGQH